HAIRICLTLLTAVFLMNGCKSAVKTGPVQYEYLQVDRQGGGQLDFRIYPGESRSNLYVYVSSSNFQPVEKRFQLQVDEENVDAIDDFYKALSGQMPLKSKLKATGKLKGTWLYLRFVRGNRETEVTDPDLIQEFSLFEKIVREQIGNH
ncbi:MAG: hypothetical protein NTY32_13405, partial [Bacteroidia bacterium]|nr:hypothetical protein [Bacteroidia bacterium]